MKYDIIQFKKTALWMIVLTMIFSSSLFAQVPQERTQAEPSQEWIMENAQAYEMMLLENATPLPPYLTEVTNPPLGQPCPLKLVLVLDESGSIGIAGAQAVRNGVNAFVGGLVGTGTKMALIEFSSNATRVAINSSTALQTVDATFQTAVSTYLTTNYSPSGLTNWTDAFTKVSEINADGVTADLVIFFTDGQPNVGGGITDAVLAADVLKGEGTRIFMLGIGTYLFVPNLQAVSGPLQVNPPTVPFPQADYGLEADLTTITTSLSNLSTAFLTDYYVDADGDGFGAGPPTTSCDAPGVNYVTDNTDCNDNDPDIYPGAPEICDGKDNDCIGVMADADCDGVEDFCDVCPGGDDSIDADLNGLPDCAFPPAFADIDPSWKCAKKKVYMCHVDELGNQFNLCISHNAIGGHMGHGDFLGPCIDCGSAKTDHAIHTGGLNMRVYPVPVQEYMIVEIVSEKDNTAELMITDYVGRVVYVRSVDLTAGNNTFDISSETLASGVYLLNVLTNDAQTTTKITIQ